MDGMPLSTRLWYMGKIKHNGWTKYRGTYQSWLDMKQRCYNPKAQQFKNYGRRGITVCRRWVTSFSNFLSDMGERPKGFTLERKDNDSGYSPSNCKWATRIEQRRNQRRCVFLEKDGKRMTVEEWGREIGKHPETLRTRIRKGYPLGMVLTNKILRRGRISPLAALERGGKDG